MKLMTLLLIPMLAACGGGGGGEEIVEAGGRDSGPEVQTADLTGLYEDGQGSRMCIIPGASGGHSFGLVLETPGGSCSGAGDASRSDTRLRLTMTGDGECAIEAAMDGTRVAFPASVAQGCSYYCAPGASLAGAVFEKTGGTADDAKRATDLAGSRLCG